MQEEVEKGIANGGVKVFKKSERSERNEGSSDDGKKALERKLVMKLGMIYILHTLNQQKLMWCGRFLHYGSFPVLQ